MTTLGKPLHTDRFGNVWVDYVPRESCELKNLAMFSKELYNVYENRHGDRFVYDDEGEIWHEYELGFSLTW